MSKPKEEVVSVVNIFLDCLGFEMDDDSFRLLPSTSGWNNAKHYMANWTELERRLASRKNELSH
jgi:hypothetical protein